MKQDFEQMIVNNPMLGSLALWEFTSKFEAFRKPAAHPTLFHYLPVLPLALSRPTATKLKTMQFESGLPKLLADDPLLIVRLQERMVALAPVTLKSINVACASGLLGKTDADVMSFTCKLKTLPPSIQPEGIANAVTLAARRLGAFFRVESLLRLQALLRISL